MMVMPKLLLLTLLTFSLLASCTTKTELDSSVPTVSYANDIAPIIAANCGQPGCHGSKHPEKFSLIDYVELARIVTPYKPNSSELYQVIRLYEGNVMPPSPNNPLTDTQIAQIYVWILQGAPLN